MLTNRKEKRTGRDIIRNRLTALVKYNIIQPLNIFKLLFCAFLTQAPAARAQPFESSKYGARVLKSPTAYRQIVQEDSNQRMVGLRTNIPGIRLQLAYAGSGNFTHARLYSEMPTETYLRLPVVRALAKVQAQLQQIGLGITIWDAYRPYSVTERLWEQVKDDRYAADPSKGSGHNRGIAVDLTIYDLQTNENLLMPTGFDNFTDSAKADFASLTSVQLRNRKLLHTLMENSGFIQLPTEWWHFSWPRPELYPLMDLSFTELRAEYVAPAAAGQPKQ